jgi:DNA-binding MarR family transcriptional regulator
MSHYGQCVSMTRARDRVKRLDIILVIVSLVTLSFALLIWISAMDIAREIVFLAATIALVISLVLIINVAILVVIRLQRRVSHLEDMMTTAEPKSPPSEKVVVVTLTNTERRVINRLEENEGQMTQDELRRATGLSKSTLSVTLSTLERKNLVSRVESGRTKIVVLEQKVTR